MTIRRIFVAIDISEDVRRAINEHVSQLRLAFADAPVKWERAEKFHLTMKFFGNTDERQLERINDLVASAAESTAPFKLMVSGPGSFRRRDSAVLWIGVEESSGQVGKLAQIAKILEANSPESRKFHPHITVARIKNPARARELIDSHGSAPIQSREFFVDHLTIYESKLLPTGSLYSVVSKHRFGSE